MTSEELRHPRINILYTPKRKQDADILNTKYSNLGAILTLFEVDDDDVSKQHLGKLYYFDNTQRFKEIAFSIAKNLRKIESFLPQYIELEQAEKVNYAIWLVSNPSTETHLVISDEIKPIQNKEINHEPIVSKQSKPHLISTAKVMIQCPHCISPVRYDRLKKHIKNIHGIQKHARNIHRTKKTAVSATKFHNPFIHKSKIKHSKPTSTKKVKRTPLPYRSKNYQLEDKDSLASITSRLLTQIEDNKQKQSAAEISKSRTKQNIGFISSPQHSNFKIKPLKPRSGKHRCRHCGKSAMIGEDICYSCIK